ncbi:MAG: cell division protein SepF [Actinomycetota bacterium]
MATVWKKTLNYLGLVEEDDLDAYERVQQRAPEPEVRRFSRPTAVRTLPAEPELTVRTLATPRATASSIHKAEPKRFDDIREVADRYKEGVPVIMNLQGTEDVVSRRLIDFASGLVYAHDGKLEQVATRVFLLTPANMEVSAEDRERLAGGGFYNQF